MGDILTSKSGLGRSFFFCKKWLWQSLGSVWAVSRPSLTTPFFRRIFQFFRAVFGQSRPIFGQFLGSFGQKMTDWTAQSVIVNR